MHRATLHDHVTGMADRLSQLARHSRICRIIGLVWSDKYHGSRQEYVVVSRAGPVLSHVSAVSKSSCIARRAVRRPVSPERYVNLPLER